MTVFEVLLLGLIQGLTEFLPVSSSGHLVLGKTLLDVEPPGATLEIALHFGTLLAILVHFRADLLAMARSILGRKKDASTGLFLLLVLGSIPAFIVAALWAADLEGLFTSPFLVSTMLILTGAVLLTSFPSGTRTVDGPRALVVGAAQALAMVPGISRSGLTIVTGTGMGLTRREAARFSFLLAVPALLGATIWKTLDGSGSGGFGTHPLNYALGAAAAFVSGYLALGWMLRLVRRGHLWPFGLYCLAVGLAGAILTR